HGHVTWFGTNAYVHGTPRLFRSPSCTMPPMAMPASKGKCPQDTESRAPPPSLSVTRPKSTTELLHQGGASSSPAQSVVATPHQDGGSHDRSQVACRSKTSLKGALARTNPYYKH